MVSILKKDKTDAYGIRHFLADEDQEIKKIGTSSLSPGSTVFVISTSSTFMLNNKKLWIKITSSNGGGNINPENPDYDGGVLPPKPGEGGDQVHPEYDGGELPPIQ